MNKKTILYLTIAFVLLTIYRILPFRLPGFAPQFALAFYSGYLFKKNYTYSFLTPLLSMFFSDLFYEAFHTFGLTEISGFYGVDQFVNYIFILSIVLWGTGSIQVQIFKLIGLNLLGLTAYFFLSNFYVWLSFGGYARPHTFGGLVQCFIDAYPFYLNGLLGTAVFSYLLLKVVHLQIFQKMSVKV